MVVFTCQHCGESVNKRKVEKHYNTKCRYNAPHLTCFDCLKDFIDNEYYSHTQCISEAQRYSAKGATIKQPTGNLKQAKYTEMIQKLLNSKNLTDTQRKLLQVCSNHENVPRKLKKFENFMANVGKYVNHTKVDEIAVFHLIEDAWKKENLQRNINSDKNETNKIVSTDKDNSELTIKENGYISNDLNEGNTITNSLPELKVAKKKKPDDSMQCSDTVGMHIDNIPSEESKENITLLSKKQLKKQKKYEKYLLELKNEVKIEDDNKQTNCDDSIKNIKKRSKKYKMCAVSLDDHANNKSNESENLMEIAEETNNKRSKKQKLHDLVLDQNEVNEKESYKGGNKKNKNKSNKCKSSPQDSEINVNGESCIAENNPVAETNHKESKKRKSENLCDETISKKKKTNSIAAEADNEAQATFDWTNVILTVLDSRPDKELSIKRLGKKVISEYQTLKPDHRSYEELLAKFNKKVKKTKGVRVLKDKAKLIE